LLVVGFFLVITPTLAQVNWNSASAMMSRYAAWSGMILVFWSIYRIMQARQIATFAATAAVTLQAFAAYHYGGPLVRHQLSSVRFTPLAEFFLAHYPQRYNPELEVFYERLFGSEASRPPTPYKFVNSDGAITKILTLSTRLGYVDEDVCGPQASLAPRSAINTARIRGPFIYINGLFSCVSTDRLDFSLAQGQTRGLSLVRGWSDSEPTGTWTIGPRATLKIDASPEIQPKDLEIEGLGFFGGVHDHVWIEIKVNGHIARRASLTSAAASFNERIGIPEPDRNPSAPIEIDITIRSPAIPASLGVSNDPRELGIFVRRVSLYSAHGTSAALGDKTIDRPEMAR
uniref:hypothetical protein n=1 Tax=Rhodopseudomonas sp. TaxID=1078 RepID=UPI003B3B234E